MSRVYCNGLSNVTLIDWSNLFPPLNGFLNGSTLMMLEQLETLNIQYNSIYGDIPKIPKSLRHLIINQNGFQGILPAFSPGLIEFSAQNNSLFGGINATQLPDTLKVLNLKGNNFNNTIIVPKSLISINLYFNAFIGDLTLDTPIYVDVGKNQFTSVSINNFTALRPNSCDISYNPILQSTVSKYDGICKMEGLENYYS